MNWIVRAVVCCTLAPVLLLARPATAQRVDASRVLEVTLQLPTQMMSASIREGGAFNLTYEAGRVEFEFVPVMQARNGTTVTMAIYRMTPGDRSTMQLVERLNLEPGIPATLRTDPEITMVVDRVRSAAIHAPASFSPAAEAAPSSTSWRMALHNDDKCCICCSGWCACGCQVTMWCAKCGVVTCDVEPVSNPGSPEDETARIAAVLGVSACARPFPAATAAMRVAVR
jgi:hypothetical protein